MKRFVFPPLFYLLLLLPLLAGIHWLEQRELERRTLGIEQSEREKGGLRLAKINKSQVLETSLKWLDKSLTAETIPGMFREKLVQYEKLFADPANPETKILQLWVMDGLGQPFDYNGKGASWDRLMSDLLLWLKNPQGSHPNENRRGPYQFLLGDKFNFKYLRDIPEELHMADFRKQGIFIIAYHRFQMNSGISSGEGDGRGLFFIAVNWRLFSEEIVGRLAAHNFNQESKGEQTYFFSNRKGGERFSSPEVPPELAARLKQVDSTGDGGEFIHYRAGDILYTVIPIQTGSVEWATPAKTNFFQFQNSNIRYENFVIRRIDTQPFLEDTRRAFIGIRLAAIILTLLFLVVLTHYRTAPFIGLKFKLATFIFIFLGFPLIIYLLTQIREITNSEISEFQKKQVAMGADLNNFVITRAARKQNILFLSRRLRDCFRGAGPTPEQKDSMQRDLDRNIIYNLVMVYDGKGQNLFNFARGTASKDSQMVATMVQHLLPFLNKKFSRNEDLAASIVAGEFLNMFFENNIFKILKNLDDFNEINLGPQIFSAYIDAIYNEEGDVETLFVAILSEDDYVKSYLRGYTEVTETTPESKIGFYFHDVSVGRFTRNLPNKWRELFRNRGLDKFSGRVDPAFDPDHLLVLQFLEKHNLILGMSFPKIQIQEIIDLQKQKLLAGLLGTILLSIALVLWGSSRILNPLDQLKAAMAAVEAQNYQYQLEINTRDEIEELGKTFNKMLLGMAENEQLALQNTLLALQEKKIQTELGVAKEIQQLLYPESIPEKGGIEIHGRCLSADAVGGDYFDFIPMAGDKMAIVVGDVSGHGMPAALLMAMAKSGTMLGLSQNIGPGLLLESLNDLVYKTMRRKRMMTYFIAQLDIQSRELLYANAGHNFPIIISESPDKFLGASSYPLGTRKKGDFKVASKILRDGDIVCFYTDGAVEAANAEGQPFGYDRLRHLITEHRHQPAPRLVELAFAAILDYSRGQPQQDDITLAVVKLAPPSPAPESTDGNSPSAAI